MASSSIGSLAATNGLIITWFSLNIDLQWFCIFSDYHKLITKVSWLLWFCSNTNLSVIHYHTHANYHLSLIILPLRYTDLQWFLIFSEYNSKSQLIVMILPKHKLFSLLSPCPLSSEFDDFASSQHRSSVIFNLFKVW